MRILIVLLLGIFVLAGCSKNDNVASQKGGGIIPPYIDVDSLVTKVVYTNDITNIYIAIANIQTGGYTNQIGYFGATNIFLLATPSNITFRRVTVGGDTNNIEFSFDP